MRELLTLNELLVMHLIDGEHKHVLTDLMIEEWEARYNESPLDIIQSLKDRHIVDEENNQYQIASQYQRQLHDTQFIFDITQERPKLLDEHKAYLVYRNNRNKPAEELLINMYDDILAYNTNPEKHQQAHVRLSELFLQIGEVNHSENHMHCAQMLETLLQMESTLVDVKMKSDADEIRARFPISNTFLNRYKEIIQVDKRSPLLLRDDILIATRQLKWDRQHLEAAANYIVLRAEEDRNAEQYLLAYLFKSAKIYNVGTIKYMRKHRLEENDGHIQVMSTERRRVQLTRPIEKPQTTYEVNEAPSDVATERRMPAKEPKKRSNFLIIFFLIVFFPVGLILMWTSHWKRWVKIVITVFYAVGVLGASDDYDSDSYDRQNDSDPYYEEEFDSSDYSQPF